MARLKSDPSSDVPVWRRPSWSAPFLAATAALLLYAFTAAPGLTWAHDGADGGDLVAAAMTGGVPHPSGYPTYCLLARAFALLPLGAIAGRLNLFSAVAAALAVGLLARSAERLLALEADRPAWRHAALAVVAALTWAAGPILWTQAIITEVYALHAFFFALALHLALRTRQRPHAFFVLGLVLGLGLGNHLTLALALPGLIVLAAERRSPRNLWRCGPSLAAGALLGLAVYAYLPLAARHDPPVNWGDPRDWEGFLWVVSGRIYRPYVFGVALADVPARLGAWVNLLVAQFTWPGVALALMGLIAWLADGRRAWAVGTLWLVLAYSAYAVGYDTTDSYVYLIPAHATVALWLARGAADAIRAVERARAGRARWAPIVVLTTLALLPAVGIVRRAPELSRRDDRAATAWLDDVTASLPPSALVIAREDRHTFALAYAQWVEGRRTDVVVVDGDLLQYPWYVAQLARRAPELVIPPKEPTVRALIAANLDRRPIALTASPPDDAAHLALSQDGPLWRVTAVR